MEKKLSVKVTYRNAQLEPVHTESYELSDYTAMLRNDIVRTISDIEDVIYVACGNKCRSEWPDEVWSGFTKIKHKLLDKAGDIERLPRNLYEGDGY